MGGRQSKQGEKMMGAEAQGGKSLSKRKARGENKSNRLEDRESARQCRLFAPTLCPRLFFFFRRGKGRIVHVVVFEVKRVDVQRFGKIISCFSHYHHQKLNLTIYLWFGKKKYIAVCSC